MIRLFVAQTPEEEVLERIAEFHGVDQEDLSVELVDEMSWTEDFGRLTEILEGDKRIRAYTDIPPAFSHALKSGLTVGLILSLRTVDVVKIYTAAARDFVLYPEMSVELTVRMEAVA